MILSGLATAARGAMCVMHGRQFITPQRCIVADKSRGMASIFSTVMVASENFPHVEIAQNSLSVPKR